MRYRNTHGLPVRCLCALAAAVMMLPAFGGCNTSPPEPKSKKAQGNEAAAIRPAGPEAGTGQPPAKAPRKYRVAHVFVALCDNANQGIVKVPPAVGNGQDPAKNLYWGAAYGVKTFFSKSPDWTAVRIVAAPKNDAVLDRCLFRSTGKGAPTYVVAEAYDGARMATALLDFLGAAAGRTVIEFDIPAGSDRARLQAGGYADVVAFVGHNGLMDVRLDEYPEKGPGVNPGGAVVLACKSRAYFLEPLRQAGCKPLVTTGQFMAPEAYTLDAILRSWSAGDATDGMARKAAAAYAKYQKIKPTAAQRIFVAGGPEARPAAEAPAVPSKPVQPKPLG